MQTKRLKNVGKSALTTALIFAGLMLAITAGEWLFPNGIGFWP
jgi:hypothetical protein